MRKVSILAVAAAAMASGGGFYDRMWERAVSTSSGALDNSRPIKVSRTSSHKQNARKQSKRGAA